MKATDVRLRLLAITLVAGPYVSVTDEHAGIRLGLHARASLAAELQEVLPLEEAARAHELSEDGHVRGKLVLRV